MRDALGGLVLLLFFTGTLLLARRTEHPGEGLAGNVRGLCVGFFKGSASSASTIYRNWPKVVGPLAYWVATFVVIVTCGAAGLAAVGVFGYGALRGVLMFLTLQPVAILGGVVLFLVSLFVGYLALLADYQVYLIMSELVTRATSPAPSGARNSPNAG